jgi:hypothetical protein
LTDRAGGYESDGLVKYLLGGKIPGVALKHAEAAVQFHDAYVSTRIRMHSLKVL